MRPLPLILAALVGTAAAVVMIPTPSTGSDVPELAEIEVNVAPAPIARAPEPRVQVDVQRAERVEAPPVAIERPKAGVTKEPPKARRARRMADESDEDARLRAERRAEVREAARERFRGRLDEMEANGELPSALLERSLMGHGKIGPER